MKKEHALLEQFISASCRSNCVVIEHATGLQLSPDVHMAIQTARKLLPLLTDYQIKNSVIQLLHDIYRDMRNDIKTRGSMVNGKKHPALEASLQAYRIIIF